MVVPTNVDATRLCSIPSSWRWPKRIFRGIVIELLVLFFTRKPLTSAFITCENKDRWSCSAGSNRKSWPVVVESEWIGTIAANRGGIKVVALACTRKRCC